MPTVALSPLPLGAADSLKMRRTGLTAQTTRAVLQTNKLLNRERDDLKRQLEDNQAEIYALEAKLERAKGNGEAMRKVEEQRDLATKEAAELRKERDSALAAVQEACEERERACEEERERALENEQWLSAALEERRRAVADMQKANSELQTQLKELERQFATTEDCLSQSQADVERLRTEVVDLQHKLADSAATLSEERVSSEKALRENRQLCESRAALESRCIAQEDEVRRLHEAMERFVAISTSISNTSMTTPVSVQQNANSSWKTIEPETPYAPSSGPDTPEGAEARCAHITPSSVGSVLSDRLYTSEKPDAEVQEPSDTIIKTPAKQSPTQHGSQKSALYMLLLRLLLVPVLLSISLFAACWCASPIFASAVVATVTRGSAWVVHLAENSPAT